jgi:preprotein translocase subunit SecG
VDIPAFPTGKERTVHPVYTPLLAANWIASVLNTLVILSGLFLILLVLIQRGKGGGLAGAFGGIGGSSAFGSRAGDTFTRVTIIVAAVWILLIMLTVKVAPESGPPSNPKDNRPTPVNPEG